MMMTFEFLFKSIKQTINTQQMLGHQKDFLIHRMGDQHVFSLTEGKGGVPMIWDKSGIHSRFEFLSNLISKV